MAKLVAVALALALAGCATRPMTWARPDGATFGLQQLSLDQTICQGEQDKAYLTKQKGLFAPDALNGVYVGCMAQHSWVQVPAQADPNADCWGRAYPAPCLVNP